MRNELDFWLYVAPSTVCVRSARTKPLQLNQGSKCPYNQNIPQLFRFAFYITLIILSLENSNYKKNFTFNIASLYQFVCIICGFPYSPNVIFIIYIFFIFSNLFIFAGFPVIRLCVCRANHHHHPQQKTAPKRSKRIRHKPCK